MSDDYNALELMIVVASRQLEDGATVVVGTGAPCAAAMLAQKAHAPDLLMLFEAGGFSPILPTMPVSVGDSRTAHRCLVATSMSEIMEMCARGEVDYAFLGGAQIDPRGNLNSTCIGDWAHPKVRFPGSGGANDLASLCWHTLVLAPQDNRRFADHCDFVTTPGYLTGPGAREEAGLYPGAGPKTFITDLCVMDFDDDKRLRAVSLHPGVDRQRAQESTGFELRFADDMIETAAPSADELNILRKEVDPHGFIIGR